MPPTRPAPASTPTVPRKPLRGPASFSPEIGPPPAGPPPWKAPSAAGISRPNPSPAPLESKTLTSLLPICPLPASCGSSDSKRHLGSPYPVCLTLLSYSWVSEHMPSLTVLLEVFADGARLAAAKGINVKAQPAGECLDWKDVPNILVHDGGNEIDLRGGIRNAFVPRSAVGPHEEAIVAGDRACLYRDAPPAHSSIDNDVITLVLAIRLGHGEALLGGLEDELQLG